MIVTEGRCIVIVLVTMVVSTVSATSPINLGPKNHLKIVGDTVEFTCVTPYRQCSGIEWFKKEAHRLPVSMYQHGVGKRNDAVFRNTQYYVNELREGCPLTIHSLRMIDSGVYLCLFLYGNGVKEAYNKSGTLLVVDPGKKQCHSSYENNAEVFKNEEYNITCSIAMQPDLSGLTKDLLVWFSKGVIINSSVTLASGVISSQYKFMARAKDILEFTCKVFVQPDPDPTYDQTNMSFEVCVLPRKTVSSSSRVSSADSSGSSGSGSWGGFTLPVGALLGGIAAAAAALMGLCAMCLLSPCCPLFGKIEICKNCVCVKNVKSSKKDKRKRKQPPPPPPPKPPKDSSKDKLQSKELSTQLDKAKAPTSKSSVDSKEKDKLQSKELSTQLDKASATSKKCSVDSKEDQPQSEVPCAKLVTNPHPSPSKATDGSYTVYVPRANA